MADEHHNDGAASKGASGPRLGAAKGAVEPLYFHGIVLPIVMGIGDILYNIFDAAI